MKAEVIHQRSLLEVADVDAELSRIEHRSSHLTEQQRFEQIQADHREANDRLASLGLSLEDLDAQISKFESEIEGVRDREDRDRKMLDGGAINAKQLADLQHELETLERRQANLEDSLLEVMERREELQARRTDELRTIDTLESELAEAQRARDDALAAIETNRQQCVSRRDELTAGLDPDLVSLYERQRSRGGPGAGRLQGRRCGACRIEIDRGEMARITAAADDEVLRCPECGAILLRVRDGGQ
jgi:predicted  nucleic acid-binding Zn-ribbon protein